MAIARLRRILQAEYLVGLRSDQPLLNRVNAKVSSRIQQFTSKNKPAPLIKTPTVIPIVQSQGQLKFRAIELLHKIGFLTTPAWINLAQLSASWATRRYFWAIAEGGKGQHRFHLSDDARRLDFHQKTLLSDELGVGMAGLLLERVFGASSFVDVSLALDDPTTYQNVAQNERTQPDYLMWGQAPQSPYYVVECKGCQTNASTSMDQLRRGLEQVPSLVFGSGARPVVTLVIATYMAERRTTVYVLDPPNEDDPGSHKRPEPYNERVSEKTGKREWKITNPKEFERRALLAHESELLKWAGQFHAASERDILLAPDRHRPTVPDLELETRKTRTGAYRGRGWPLFPELGRKNLRIFTGVEEELLSSISSRLGETGETAESVRRRLAQLKTDHERPYESLTSDGTCMIVEGID